MRLYRYRQFSQHALEGLAKATSWCSEISAFNDPYELQFELDISGGYPELEQLREFWQRRFPHRQFDRKMVRYDAADIIKSSRRWYGVCCFSEVPMSSQMWAYYAASHTGFCLGFDFPTTGPQDAITQAHLNKVDYRTTRPEFPIRNFMGDPVELKTSLMNLLTVKHIDWQHEKEWRFINEKPNQLVRYDHSALKDVIVGARASAGHKSQVRAICDRLPTEVRFRQLVLKHGTYELRSDDEDDDFEYNWRNS